jgi:hypothetical protein
MPFPLGRQALQHLLAFLAIENSDTCNENAATDNQPSPYATERCSDA